MTNYNIAIFASGGGTNAEMFFEYFRSNKCANISLLLSNNKNAFALKRAEKNDIPNYYCNREDFYENDKVKNILAVYAIDFIVLAGFLWKVPDELIALYPNKIVNIHPALLPKFGGKGMYGRHVHEAVMAAGEKESGITIHYVNQNYDEGQIIFQKKCELTADDTISTITEKVQKLEHKYYTEVVENLLSDL